MSAWHNEPDAPKGHGVGNLVGGPQDRTWPDPPDLMLRSAEPQYDARDLVGLLGVPPRVLWGWEQSLGIPRPIRVPDERGEIHSRYSERDLMAALWLRDQVRAGMSPIEAVRRLLAAQRPLPQLPRGALPAAAREPPTPSGPVARGRVSTSIFPTSTPSLRVHAGTSGPAAWSGPPSIPLQPAPVSGPIPASSQAGVGMPSIPSGPLSHPAFGTLRHPSGPLTHGPAGGPLVGSLGHNSLPGPASGPLLGGQAHAPASTPLRRASVTAVFPPMGDAAQPQGPRTNPGTATSGRLSGSGSLHMFQGALLTAFTALDERETCRLLDEVLSEYPIETVCASLIQPLISRAAELAADGRIPPDAEHFGSVMIRNRLGAVLEALHVAPSAPLALVACPPSEYHDLGPLMVTIFWRRAGVRAIFLGPDVAEDTLLRLAREHWQALFCLSAATDAGARHIGRVAAAIARLDPPRPMIGYGGAAFVRSPDLQRHVKESYFLGVDASMATRHVVQLLTEGPLGGSR